MRTPVMTGLALALALSLLPHPAAADPTPLLPPGGVAGDYDPETGVLQLTWNPVAADTVDTLYGVYRNGVLIATTTATHYVEEIKAVLTVYQVSTMGAQGASVPSPPVVVWHIPTSLLPMKALGPTLTKPLQGTDSWGGSVYVATPFSMCPPITYSIYEREPFFAFNLHDECVIDDSPLSGNAGLNNADPIRSGTPLW